ncbi:AAA family ATPase [Candidatus Nomurabacteria bacterium]|nr:AAA family ATPase [Candidatus Nomurabacteria bacterium]
MPTSKHVIGITGLMSSGKGTAAHYLKEKYGASTYTFSTMLKDVLSRFYLDHTRDALVKTSEFIRGTFGEDIMAKTMAKDVESDPSPLIVVEGIRRNADIEYLKKIPGFQMVEIVADPEIRYQRLIQRTEKADDQSKTYEQFLEDHKRSTEVSILEVAKHADISIDNNGDEQSLQRQLDKLINT